MKSTLIIFLHAAYWLSYLLLSMILTYALVGNAELGAENDATETVLFMAFLFTVIMPAIVTFYTFYFFLFPLFFTQKRITLAFLAGAGVSVTSICIGLAALGLTFPNCMSEADTEMLVPFLAIVGGFNFAGGGIAFVIRGFYTWFEEVEKREALQRKNHTMELDLIKSQLDPHFLFNTINNIDVLILKDQEKASDYLNRLSDIMRFMLYETKTDEIPLTKEIAYIDKYVALQKIRTTNEAYIDFQVKGSPAGRLIAPLVFIPFIENAFKHTTNKKMQGAIVLRLIIRADSIYFSCSNQKGNISNPVTTSGGLGNELIRKRLELLYPARHELLIRDEDGRYSVDLTLNT